MIWRIFNFVTVAILIPSALCCVGFDSIDKDYWGDDQLVTNERSRSRREISLENRVNCQPEDEQPNTRINTTIGISLLRDQMELLSLDAYIIPSGDENQNEYVPDADRRRAYVSGFTGSSGTAVVTNTKQALWTDGRYFLEAENQLDCNWILMKEKEDGVPKIQEWLKEQLPEGATVGVDPRLMPSNTFQKYSDELKESGIKMKGEDTNLVDEIWPADVRPQHSTNPIYVLDTKYTGKNWEDKVAEVREEMKKKKVDLFVITGIDEVAWLLNLRGDDVPHNPVFRSYIIMDMNRIILFLPEGKITPAVDHHLRVDNCDQGGTCVETQKYTSVVDQLRAMAASPIYKKVLLPKKYAYSEGASYAIVSAVPEEKRVLDVSPIINMKSKKNEVEFNGMKNAHKKDAIALIDFLAMLEEEIENGNEWDEITASEKLEEYRSQQEDFVDLSFETISAFGPNGAIIHYRPTPQTVAKITKDNMYLLDSGGQYKDGTTDVTRTMHYGTPTEYQIETYTRVLMGALNLASLVFPKGTPDNAIDIMARRPLYDIGLDYNHGTGHGIGMFLNIHESPTQLRIYSDEPHKLEVGQFFSDEPGYYKDHEFGIRLETILAVVEKETQYKFHKTMLGFEPITLVPFEPKLINISMLTTSQCSHLNIYHMIIRNALAEELKDSKPRAYDWLMKKTEPIACNSELLSPIPMTDHSTLLESINHKINHVESKMSSSSSIHLSIDIMLSSLFIISYIIKFRFV